MAEVYESIGGRKLTQVVAGLPEVQLALDAHTDILAARARAILDMSAERTGTSYIETAQGRIDRYVVLNDERGQKAAMTIEFGRNADSPQGPSEPVAPLRIAASMPIHHRFIGPRLRNGRTTKKRR